MAKPDEPKRPLGQPKSSPTEPQTPPQRREQLENEKVYGEEPIQKAFDSADPPPPPPKNTKQAR